MTRQVLFVHGGGGGAHAEDAKLVASLSEQLGPNYRVRYPMLPNEADPDYRTWKRLITEEVASMGEGAVLVGHSIGASVLLKMVADQALQRPVAGVFSSAAPFWHDHEVWRWKDVELPGEIATLLPSELPMFLYHGVADEVVPIAHVDMHAALLPNAIVRRREGRNHQLDEELTEVAEDIKTICLFPRSAGVGRLPLQ